MMDILIYTFLAGVVYFVGFVANSLGAFDSFLNIKDNLTKRKEIKKINEPFLEKPGVVNVLIFPFTNYSQTSASNLSQGIYEKIKDLKERLELDNLNIRYYSLLKPEERTRENIFNIGKKLKAGFIVRGT